MEIHIKDVGMLEVTRPKLSAPWQERWRYLIHSVDGQNNATSRRRHAEPDEKLLLPLVRAQSLGHALFDVETVLDRLSAASASRVRHISLNSTTPPTCRFECLFTRMYTYLCGWNVLHIWDVYACKRACMACAFRHARKVPA
jgi:hypothetical protein